jgi:large subunit ribosomal protein L4e
MKANVISVSGSSKGTIELPKVFETEYNPTLIRRAGLALQTTKKQPKGTDPRAGKKNTARYRGYRGVPTPHRIINTENARLPRLTNRRYLLYGRTAFVPHVVGGRAAHPLKSWETIVEQINKKERKIALASAIAATANKSLVEKRFIVEKELPIIVEDAIENIAKTKEAIETLTKIGVGKDLENAKSKVRKRAGRGKSRGRIWKAKKSVLIVTGKNSPILKAVRNLPGVDSVTTASLNVDLVAPGAEAGRLVVWTESAIKELGKEKSEKIETPKAIKEKKVVTKKVVKKSVKAKAKKE